MTSADLLRTIAFATYGRNVDVFITSANTATVVAMNTGRVLGRVSK